MKTKKIAISSVALAIFLAAPLSVRAAFNYVPMEKIPGFEGSEYDQFPRMVEGIYKFGIWTIGIAALFMVTWGGFTYMTSAGNTAKAGSGKKVITDALIGVVLALCAFLIFNIINPNITSVEIQVTPGNVAAPPPPPPPLPPPPALPGTLRESAAALLANSNINVLSSGDCSSAAGTVSPRMNLEQVREGSLATSCNADCATSTCGGITTLSVNLLNNINRLSETFRPLTIISLAGGAHSNTSLHYQGKAADIAPTGDKSRWPAAVSQLRAMGCQAFCDNKGNNVPCPQASHIHVSC